MTGYHFWPLEDALFFGQADSVILATLVFALAASKRLRPIWSGVLVGLSGLLKAWPAGAVLYFLRRGERRRAPGLAAFLTTLFLAPLGALAISGVSGLEGMFANIFDARSQARLIGYSVWASRGSCSRAAA